MEREAPTSSNGWRLRSSLGSIIFLLVSCFCNLVKEIITISSQKVVDKNWKENQVGLLIPGWKEASNFHDIPLSLSPALQAWCRFLPFAWPMSIGLIYINVCVKFQTELYIEKKVTVLRNTCLIKAPWLNDNSFNRYSAANFLSISTINEFLLRCLSLTRSPFARARSCKNQRELFLLVCFFWGGGGGLKSNVEKKT